MTRFTLILRADQWTPLPASLIRFIDSKRLFPIESSTAFGAPINHESFQEIPTMKAYRYPSFE